MNDVRNSSQEMNILKKIKPETLRSKSGWAVMVTAAVLLEVTIAVQYLFTRRGIRQEVQYRAKAELRVKNMEIHNMVTAVEVAARNTVWAVEESLGEPDSIYSVLRRLVTQNKNIVGCGVMFVADYYPEKGRWFEPYVAERDNGDIDQRQIGSATHDYLSEEWFQKGMAAGKGYWTEPYEDEAGARATLSTFTLPLRDRSGRIVALLGADVSLEWLNTVVNAQRIYPSSYNVIISREGKVMVGPNGGESMKSSIQEATADIEDTATVRSINRRMMAGVSGQDTLYDNRGEMNYIFFTPVDKGTGWSIAVVCSDREIFYGLRQMGFNLTLLMLLGMVLLGFIIVRTGRNFKLLQAVNAEKERIGSELRIASSIQQGMLPKTFPPFPERDDVEIYGSLVSAKEVGGDLYDFFIRDEKLFFIIGDVSGKGVPASLVMAVTRSLFRMVANHESLPNRIVSSLNDSMTETNEVDMFVTLFVGALDLPTGRLRYCNAGHTGPVLIGDKVGMLPVEPNLPVGLVKGWKYAVQEALVLPQTTIFLFTDGLTEAMNPLLALFGEKRMLAVANAVLEKQENNPEIVIQRMSEAVAEYVGPAEQSDDLTMLAIQYTKAPTDIRIHRAITLPNDVKQIDQLHEFVDEVCESLEFKPSTTMQMNLALEEAVVNVMNYAYPTGTVGNVEVSAEANDAWLKFTITDQGTPFDPTAKEEVDITLSIEERPIGGLGIHLVRKMMDSINYERIDGCNVLTLLKKL